MRIRFVFILILFFASTFGFSQTDSTERKNLFVIKADVLLPSISLIIGQKIFSLTGEFGFSDRHSLQLTGISFFRNTGIYNKADTKFVVEDYKFFHNKEKRYTGFYNGVYCDQIFEHAISDKDPNIQIEYKTISIGGGILFGYETYFKKRISLDFIIGFGRSYVIHKEYIRLVGVTGVIIPAYWPDLRLALNIGYRF